MGGLRWGCLSFALHSPRLVFERWGLEATGAKRSFYLNKPKVQSGLKQPPENQISSPSKGPILMGGKDSVGLSEQAENISLLGLALLNT